MDESGLDQVGPQLSHGFIKRGCKLRDARYVSLMRAFKFIGVTVFDEQIGISRQILR